jgi:hypothetical protein
MRDSPEKTVHDFRSQIVKAVPVFSDIELAWPRMVLSRQQPM